MIRDKRRFAVTVVVSALVGAVLVYLRSDALLEGAVVGAIFGGSLGMIVAMWHRNEAKSVAYEYEAAGLPDDNLTTIARRDFSKSAQGVEDFKPGP